MFLKINSNIFKRAILLSPYVLITIVLVIIPLILVIIKSFVPSIDSTSNNSLQIKQNWNFLGSSIFQKIFLSIGTAVATTILCLIIGYLFAYFLSLTKKPALKIIAISLITSPLWISVLIKLVGIKTLFDFINQAPNSTFGTFYTILALTYINLPIFILTIYTHINLIPKNLLDASKDLGKNSIQTFFYVVIPYTKQAIISGLILVFLPSLTNAGVTQFVNNSNSGSLIGNDLLNQGLEGSSSQIALARVSSLSLVISSTVLVLWSIFLIIKFLFKFKTKKIRRIKNA